MKKWMIGLGSIVLAGIVGAAIFFSQLHGMMKYFKEYYLTNVNLQSVSDGTYRGSCGKFLVAVDLEAKVLQHRIADIKIVTEKCGKGYDAKKVVERVLQAQSLNVDVVSGATASSKCILIALELALTAQKAK
jgi:uncharacterized protein with FMN-binding domain